MFYCRYIVLNLDLNIFFIYTLSYYFYHDGTKIPVGLTGYIGPLTLARLCISMIVRCTN